MSNELILPMSDEESNELVDRVDRAARCANVVAKQKAREGGEEEGQVHEPALGPGPALLQDARSGVRSM
eukprot:5858975-Pleurochrysis_carterae.AAC.1